MAAGRRSYRYGFTDGCGRCPEHLDKIIFMTKEEVTEYARIHRPWERIEAYPCPVKGKNHFHARDRTKRNKSSRRHKWG